MFNRRLSITSVLYHIAIYDLFGRIDGKVSISSSSLTPGRKYLFGWVPYDMCNALKSCKINTQKPRSCLDIYNEDCRSPSGEYILYKGNESLRVYCSFEKDRRGKTDYSYTFISRRASGTSFDIRSLYTTSNFAKLRILDVRKSSQKEVIVENFSKYSHIDLKFALNGDSKYQRPYYLNRKLHPYLFLGFLDISLSRNRNVQGYRTAGRDFTFKNCDSNPNSYIAFFFDPNFGTMRRTHEDLPRFMQQWISLSTAMKYPKYMKDEFYMDWEMHMGGCGGFQTSKTIYKKAALGMPFALPSKKCR